MRQPTVHDRLKPNQRTGTRHGVASARGQCCPSLGGTVLAFARHCNDTPRSVRLATSTKQAELSGNPPSTKDQPEDQVTGAEVLWLQARDPERSAKQPLKALGKLRCTDHSQWQSCPQSTPSLFPLPLAAFPAAFPAEAKRCWLGSFPPTMKSMTVMHGATKRLCLLADIWSSSCTITNTKKKDFSR
jgi:hypothetical protein